MKQLTTILFILFTVGLFGQVTYYINPDVVGGTGDGLSEVNAFDNWNDIRIASNTTYLQKRGTTCIMTGILFDLGSGDFIEEYTDILFGAYGTGERPILSFAKGTRGCYMKFSHNITVRDLELVGNNDNTGEFSNYCFYLSTDPTYGIDMTDIKIINCEIHNWFQGFYISTFAVGGIVDTVLIDSCEIHDIGQDAILGAAHRFTISNNHIHRINRRWHTVSHDHDYSGGDDIQIAGLDYHIYNNIIDRRWTSNKFNILIGYNALGKRGIIEWNTIYPPKDTIGDDGPSCFYLSALDEHCIIRYNKILGTGYDAAAPAAGLGVIYSDTLSFYYNLMDSVGGLRFTHGYQKYASFYNNTWLHGGEAYDFCINVGNSPLGSAIELRNNIYAMDTGNEGVLVYSATPTMSNNIEEIGDSANWDSNIGFVDWENGDYHITSGSPAHNTGYSYSGYNIDMDSIAVPIDIRDVGIYEYYNSGVTTNSLVIYNDSRKGVVTGEGEYEVGSSPVVTCASINNTSEFKEWTSVGAGHLDDYYSDTTFVISFHDNPIYLTTIYYDKISFLEESFDVDVLEDIGNGEYVIDGLTMVGAEGEPYEISILSGNDDGIFEMGGVLDVNVIILDSTKIDYEITKSYELILELITTGSSTLKDTTNLIVNILNVNEPPIVKSQAFDILESALNGTVLGTIFALDDCHGIWSSDCPMEFTIDSGNTDSVFDLDIDTGVLSVNDETQLNYSTHPSYTLVIDVEDDDRNVTSMTATVTVIETASTDIPNLLIWK